MTDFNKMTVSELLEEYQHTAKWLVDATLLYKETKASMHRAEASMQDLHNHLQQRFKELEDRIWAPPDRQ